MVANYCLDSSDLNSLFKKKKKNYCLVLSLTLILWVTDFLLVLIISMASFHCLVSSQFVDNLFSIFNKEKNFNIRFAFYQKNSKNRKKHEKYIYFVYTKPSAWTRYYTRSIFKQSFILLKWLPYQG